MDFVNFNYYLCVENEKPKHLQQMADLVDKNFKYFLKAQPELYAKYPNKYLVIKDEAVVYAADTLEGSLGYTLEHKLEPGTFLLQQCKEGENAYTQTFYSRAIFL